MSPSSATIIEPPSTAVEPAVGVAAADADAVLVASDGALVGVAEGVLLLLLQADATIARTASSEAHRFISTPFL
jgi:hypothetical protein